MPPHATWTILTPPAAQGAIGVIQLRAPSADDLTALLASLSLPVEPGRPALRDLLGVDRGLAVRWGPTTADLFCHGGPAVIRRLAAGLEGREVRRGDTAQAEFPEAADDHEARMLAALAQAASPRAIDLLLDQPRRWRAWRGGACADASVLNRLIDPPLVVALGPANIGKSTLLNALAGRAVAIVADQPGTTRDHVGAMLELDGLAVRYLDTPGLLPDPGELDRRAQDLVRHAIEAADLVLACGDPLTPGPDQMRPDRPPGLRVCLRADLGEPAWAHDLALSVHGSRRGLDALARAVRVRLLPDSALADPRPWRFWERAEPRS